MTKRTIFSIGKTQNPPRLLKDGKPVFSMMFWQTSIEEQDGRAFTEAGVELFTFTRSFQAYEHPFYVGEDTYDFTYFDGEIEKFRRACPGKFCIPRVFICAPYWWLEAHPEERCRYARPTEIYRHGGDRPLTQGTLHESMASERWKRDMGQALRMLIRHIRSSERLMAEIGKLYRWGVKSLSRPRPRRSEVARRKNDPSARAPVCDRHHRKRRARRTSELDRGAQSPRDPYLSSGQVRKQYCNNKKGKKK